MNPKHYLVSGLPPNQSLKLTEPAVDDFARAKHPATVGRAYHARIGFRRYGTSLPQLSSGPLGGITSCYKEQKILGLKELVYKQSYFLIAMSARKWYHLVRKLTW